LVCFDDVSEELAKKVQDRGFKLFSYNQVLEAGKGIEYVRP